MTPKHAYTWTIHPPHVVEASEDPSWHEKLVPVRDNASMPWRHVLRSNVRYTKREVLEAFIKEAGRKIEYARQQLAEMEDEA